MHVDRRFTQLCAVTFLSLVLMFATGAASAQPDGTDCSPAPAPRAGAPDIEPIYISRDSVSCRFESNHRYTTRVDVADALTADGWIL